MQGLYVCLSLFFNSGRLYKSVKIWGWWQAAAEKVLHFPHTPILIYFQGMLDITWKFISISSFWMLDSLWVVGDAELSLDELLV